MVSSTDFHCQNQTHQGRGIEASVGTATGTGTTGTSTIPYYVTEGHPCTGKSRSTGTGTGSTAVWYDSCGVNANS